VGRSPRNRPGLATRQRHASAPPCLPPPLLLPLELTLAIDVQNQTEFPSSGSVPRRNRHATYASFQLLQKHRIVRYGRWGRLGARIPPIVIHRVAVFVVGIFVLFVVVDRYPRLGRPDEHDARGGALMVGTEPCAGGQRDVVRWTRGVGHGGGARARHGAEAEELWGGRGRECGELWGGWNGGGRAYGGRRQGEERLAFCRRTRTPVAASRAARRSPHVAWGGRERGTAVAPHRTVRTISAIANERTRRPGTHGGLGGGGN